MVPCTEASPDCRPAGLRSLCSAPRAGGIVAQGLGFVITAAERYPLRPAAGQAGLQRRPAPPWSSRTSFGRVLRPAGEWNRPLACWGAGGGFCDPDRPSWGLCKLLMVRQARCFAPLCAAPSLVFRSLCSKVFIG